MRVIDLARGEVLMLGGDAAIVTINSGVNVRVAVLEHDMQFIRMLATTVPVLHQGAVFVEDTLEATLKDPAVRASTSASRHGVSFTGPAPPRAGDAITVRSGGHR
jgi:ABC-type uncharacterized transport system ATPase subunit